MIESNKFLCSTISLSLLTPHQYSEHFSLPSNKYHVSRWWTNTNHSVGTTNVLICVWMIPFWICLIESPKTVKITMKVKHWIRWVIQLCLKIRPLDYLFGIVPDFKILKFTLSLISYQKSNFWVLWTQFIQLEIMFFFSKTQRFGGILIWLFVFIERLKALATPKRRTKKCETMSLVEGEGVCKSREKKRAQILLR